MATLVEAVANQTALIAKLRSGLDCVGVLLKEPRSGCELGESPQPHRTSARLQRAVSRLSQRLRSYEQPLADRYLLYWPASGDFSRSRAVNAFVSRRTEPFTR